MPTISSIIEKLKSDAEYPRAALIADLEKVESDLMIRLGQDWGELPKVDNRGATETRN